MNPRVAELEQLMLSGGSLADALEQVAPPAYRASTELMRRASAVGAFDRKLFDDVIQTGFRKALSFEEFLCVEGVRRIGETGLVDEVTAVEHLRAWIAAQGSDDIVKLFGHVYEHLSMRTDAPVDSLARLRFWLVASPSEGLREFEHRFKEADDAFDLATCHALVQVIRQLDLVSVGNASAELKLASPGQRARADQLGPYVAIRGRFIDEYIKSDNYLERATLHRKVDAFLADDGEWMLSIYGPGGRGKTMLMRWLVARRCLPLPHAIPVAKVDCDDINLARLVRFPWLILVTIAEQLNRQLPGAPFTEFLDRLVDYAPMLLPGARPDSGLSEDGLARELEQAPWVATVAQDFAFKLGNWQVVVVLDTLEELVLHFPGALRGVLATLRTLHGTTAGNNRLKLVLCGRYDLRARGHLSADDPIPVNVDRFSSEEARVYLAAKRGIDDSLIDAITIKARGNPFILSLIADLVDHNDIDDAAGINRLEPEYAYLIERVINRIPAHEWAVRWVVRYGVVPRRLTRDFFDQVILPHLEREVRSDSAHMDGLGEYGASFPRKEAPGMQKLWSSLRSYADATGWLHGDESELRFQPDVVQPMRALLAREPIYLQLHREAAQWFERQAHLSQADPLTWARNLAEVFHHRLQLRTPGLDRWCQELLRQPQANDPAARSMLLETVAMLLPMPDAVPRDGGGAPLFGMAFLQSVHLELAREAAGICWGAMPPPPQPQTASRLLESLRAFEAQGDIPSARVLDMAMHLHAHDHARALSESRRLESVVQTLPPQDQYAFHVLTARALAGLGKPAAQEAYLQAIDVARRNEQPAWSVLGECCRQLVLLGQAARAVSLGRSALAQGADVPPAFVLGMADLFLRVGEQAQAEALAGAALVKLFRSRAPDMERRAQRVLYACMVERGQCWAMQGALSLVTSADPLEHAQYNEVNGMYAAARYELDKACTLLQKAVRDYGAAGDGAAAEAAMLRTVRVTKELMGDWSGAYALLTRWSSAGSDALAVEKRHLQALLNIAPVASDPQACCGGLRDMAALLTDGERAHDRMRMEGLLCHLEGIDHVPDRRACLHWLRYLPRLTSVSRMEDAFMRLVPLPRPGDADFFPHIFDCIELLRCLGSNQVVPAIRLAFAEASAQRAFVYEPLLDAAQRAGCELASDEVSAILTHCQQVDGQALDVATRIMLLAILCKHGDQRASTLAARSIDLPDCLRGTRFEAMHCANGWYTLTRNNKLGAAGMAKQAAELWRSLGQERRARQLLAQSEAGLPAPPPVAGHSTFVDLRALASPLDASAAAMDFEAALALLDEQALVRRMRFELPDPALSAATVQLGIDGASTASLPWEWALPSSAVCFRSSRNMPLDTPRLLTNLVWRCTPVIVRRGVQSFMPLHIALLRPSSAVQHRSRRGFEVTARRSLGEILGAQGAQVVEPAGGTKDAIAELVRRQFAHLIYIQAPVIEHRGQLSIDLPLVHDESGEGGNLDIDFWVHQFRLIEAGFEPVVLLAPPRPTSDVEVARQLLLRNEFACELARRAQVRAVLGAGLFEASQSELAAEQLAYYLGSNPSLRQLLMLIRNELPGDRFCTRGATLFAANPSCTLK